MKRNIIKKASFNQTSLQTSTKPSPLLDWEMAYYQKSAKQLFLVILVLGFPNNNLQYYVR